MVWTIFYTPAYASYAGKFRKKLVEAGIPVIRSVDPCLREGIEVCDFSGETVVGYNSARERVDRAVRSERLVA